MQHSNQISGVFPSCPTKANIDIAGTADKLLSEIDFLGYEIQVEIVSHMTRRISDSVDHRIASLNKEKTCIESELKHLTGMARL